MIKLIYLTNNENLLKTRLHILAIFFILQYTYNCKLNLISFVSFGFLYSVRVTTARLHTAGSGSVLCL